jgi:methylglyoxal synthase
MAQVKMQNVKNIVLIAHDSKKKDLLEWAVHRAVLKEHRLFATGTTEHSSPSTSISKSRASRADRWGRPAGGARIGDGELDILIFFWDPLEPQPHDPDVKALLRIAVLPTSRAPAIGRPRIRGLAAVPRRVRARSRGFLREPHPAARGL